MDSHRPALRPPSLDAEDTPRPLQQQARAARADLVSGSLRGQALLDMILSVPYCERDAWVDALLGLDDAPPDAPDLPRGAVPYLPCGVDEILALVRETPLHAGTELVDLGSGLGRVAILAHLLCGARAHGIEIQAPLVQLARRRCAALGLSGVTFAHGDAAAVELSGTVFFLYAPFNGAMLKAVLAQLKAVAQGHPITLCCVALDLRSVPWLRAREPALPSVSLYDSCA